MKVFFFQVSSSERFLRNGTCTKWSCGKSQNLGSENSETKISKEDVDVMDISDDADDVDWSEVSSGLLDLIFYNSLFCITLPH